MGGARLDPAKLWTEYTDYKQTYSQLGEKYNCSARTIKRKLDSYVPPSKTIIPREVIVVMDTTYFGKNYGVMLFKDAITTENLSWTFVKNETNDLYADGIANLEKMGFKIIALVFDGRRGLPNKFPGKLMQLCQFHQQKTVRRYLTKHPKTEAGKELKQIVDMLSKTDKESFIGMFDEWCTKWSAYIKERTTDPETGKSHYTHKRLRSAYLSLKRNIPLLFTWYDHLDMDIPNTTNLIDGHFSNLKRMLGNHNGMSMERREKMIIGFLEA